MDIAGISGMIKEKLLADLRAEAVMLLCHRYNKGIRAG